MVVAAGLACGEPSTSPEASAGESDTGRDTDRDDADVDLGTSSTGSDPTRGPIPVGPVPEAPSSPGPVGLPAPPAEGGPQFVNVTAAAGLLLPTEANPWPPDCAIDNLLSIAPGDFCTPQRFVGAVAVGDFDADGWPDLYLSRSAEPGKLFRNRGDGSFQEVDALWGLDAPIITGGAAWLDIEGDGDLDLLLTSIGDTRNFLYVNDGGGHFSEQAQARGVAVDTGYLHVGTSIAVGDYDLDGWLDVFVADWHTSNALGTTIDHNRLLHNLGARDPGVFEDVTTAVGIDVGPDPFFGAHGFAPAFVDLDDDGWPELAIASDFRQSQLYFNAGGTFVDATLAAGVGTEFNGMGSTFGDIDGDGDLDWFVSAIAFPTVPDSGNRLYRNEGDRTFADVTDLYGVRDGGWGWGASFIDLDLDGALDLALAAGWPNQTFGADPVRVWRGASPPWPDVAAARGLDHRNGSRAVVPIDFDRDGDLDLLVHANTESPALYRNDAHDRGWLEVRIDNGGGNPRGLGCVVHVQAGDAPPQVRHVGVGGHLGSHAEAAAYFGFGPDAPASVRVQIDDPVTGNTVVRDDVPLDQRLVVTLR
jgi:hypothetical protein